MANKAAGKSLRLAYGNSAVYAVLVKLNELRCVDGIVQKLSSYDAVVAVGT
jgi:hypothetical protein